MYLFLHVNNLAVFFPSTEQSKMKEKKLETLDEEIWLDLRMSFLSQKEVRLFGLSEIRMVENRRNKFSYFLILNTLFSLTVFISLFIPVNISINLFHTN